MSDLTELLQDLANNHELIIYQPYCDIDTNISYTYIILHNPHLIIAKPYCDNPNLVLIAKIAMIQQIIKMLKI